MFRAIVLALLGYNSAGCRLDEQFCSLVMATDEKYCTFGSCVTCADDPDWTNEFGDCETYENGHAKANHGYCIQDKAHFKCGVACGSCDPADNTKAGEVGALTDWSRWEPGSCPAGYGMVTVIGANSYFDTESTHCLDGCVLIGNMDDYYNRFFSLTKDGAQQTAFYKSTESCVTRGWEYELGRLEEITTQITIPGGDMIVAANVFGVGYFSRDVPKGPSDGFDFTTGGCQPDSGFFFKELPVLKKTYEIGIIPKGKVDVFVKLKSDEDLDIQLYDTTITDPFEEGKAIIAWCPAPSSCNYGHPNLMMHNTGGSIDYVSESLGPDGASMKIEYSGFSPDPEAANMGDEYIRITGATTVDLKLIAYSYKTGNVEVKYTWGGDLCCNGQVDCEGSFTRNMTKGDIVPIGDIPSGVLNFDVQLTSDQDIDLQLYDQDMRSEKHPEGEAIIGWCDTDENPDCNYGYIAGYAEETLPDYRGLGNNYTYSGYNGVNYKWGHEFIRITGITQIPVGLAAYAYLDGIANVRYTFRHQTSSSRSRGLTDIQLENQVEHKSKRVALLPGRELIEE